MKEDNRVDILESSDLMSEEADLSSALSVGGRVGSRHG